jgi:predicted RNA-binding protein with PUA-like domain
MLNRLIMVQTRRSATSTAASAVKSTSKSAKLSSSSSTTKKSNSKTVVEDEVPLGPRKWLIKSEPESRIEDGMDMRFSIDDLINCADQTESWDGVRNHQAKNNLKAMKLGDEAFFYHSNCKTPGVVGIVEIVREAYPDPTSWESGHPHHDPKSSEDNPRWFMVDVKFKRKLKRLVGLAELKQLKDSHECLKNMMLLSNSRLSVQKVTDEQWQFVVDRASREPEE